MDIIVYGCALLIALICLFALVKLFPISNAIAQQLEELKAIRAALEKNNREVDS